MAFRPSVHIPLLFVVFGAIFAAAGTWFLVDTSAGTQLTRGEALGAVTGATLSQHAVGEVVLVQGRVAASSHPVFRDFAAALRQRYDGMNTGSGTVAQRERWSTIENAAPPLTLDTSDGPVAVINSGYELRAPLHYWRDAPTVGEKDLLTTYERASGFMAGDLVTVEARVVESADAGQAGRHVLAATVMFGGDHAAYLANLSDGVLVTRVLGSVFTGLGVLIAAVAGLIAWRASRAPAPREVPQDVDVRFLDGEEDSEDDGQDDDASDTRS